MNRKLNHALASLVLMYSATPWSQEATMATINGQGEYQLSGDIECGGEATSTIKPGERHEEIAWVLLHVAGDDTFAKLLAGQSSEVREGYAGFFADFGTAFFSNPKAYIKLHFPKTYAILYGR
jgi:hypothetical protein